MSTDNRCKIIEFPNIEQPRTPRDPSASVHLEMTEEEAAEFNALVAAAVLDDESANKNSMTSGNPRLAGSELPDGIRKRMIKQYLTAGAIAFLTMLLSIGYRQPLYLAGFIISGVLVYLGVATKADFIAGNIEEIPVICASVSRGVLRKTTRVVFRTADETPAYYEFIVPGKMEHEIFPNYAYIIYFRSRNPKELIGFTPI